MGNLDIKWWQVPLLYVAAAIEDVKTKISFWNDRRKAKKEKRFPEDYVVKKDPSRGPFTP